MKYIAEIEALQNTIRQEVKLFGFTSEITQDRYRDLIKRIEEDNTR